MFRALLAHPKEALHKRHLVYCVSIISVTCATIAVKLKSWQSQITLYALYHVFVELGPLVGSVPIKRTTDEWKNE
jgi:hypothetical protein